MSNIFVDTSGRGNLFDRSEPYYSQAMTIYREVQKPGRKLVTTNYIIAELVSILISPFRVSHPTIVFIIEELNLSKYVEIVHIDQDLHGKAWDLFVARPDKLWSLVDCSSFAIMQDRGITEALTADHHFEQAGFNRLLK